MIRKDLNSQNQYDAGVTLSGLACFINQDLARDLANDLMTLVSTRLIDIHHVLTVGVLSSCHPQNRTSGRRQYSWCIKYFSHSLMPFDQPFPVWKRSWKILTPVSWNHVIVRLLITDLFISLSGVQSAAVNVVCELARKNPKNYLSLAPIFFKLMTSSTNNWMLIKIIKLVSQHPLSRLTVFLQ